MGQKLKKGPKKVAPHLRIREVLEKKGKTQAWLADELEQMGLLGENGVISVSRWANGHREPSLKVIYAIAKLLKVDPCDLLNR